MTSSTAINDLHPDVLARALRRMDGPTLAAFACTSSRFRSLSADPSIWRSLCLNSFPSLRLLPIFPLLSPRSLFAGSFPSHSPDSSPSPSPLPTRLFSAVDAHYSGTPIFSVIIDTDTSSPWFLGSVFHIDAVIPQTRTVPSERLELSWIIVDATTGDAANVSSRQAVAVERQWCGGEARVRFATVVDGYAVGAVVACGKVSLMVEDGDGKAVDGREGLGILAAAMRGKKRRGGEREAERRYEEYLRRRRERKARKAKREGMVDLCCTGFCALVFFSFILLIAFK